ncbi:MAG: hypothetical protein OCD01_13345 [Fibrobacterales bacterium]
MKYIIYNLLFTVTLFSADVANTFDFLGTHTSPLSKALNGISSSYVTGTQALGVTPAGIHLTQASAAVALSAQFGIDGDKAVSLSGVKTLNKRLTGGLSLHYTQSSSIQMLNNANEPIGKTDPYDYIFAAHGAYRLSERFTLGVSGKYIAEYLTDAEYGTTAQGLALDIGSRYIALPNELLFAATLMNLGKQITGHTKNSKTESLNTSLKLGGSYTNPSLEILTLNLESEYFINSPYRIGASIAAAIHPAIKIYVGYAVDNNSLKAMTSNYDNANQETTIATGGFSLLLSSIDIHYALELHRFSLDPTHFAGLNWRL